MLVCVCVCVCVCQRVLKVATVWTACSNVAVRTQLRVMQSTAHVLVLLDGLDSTVNCVCIIIIIIIIIGVIIIVVISMLSVKYRDTYAQ